MLTLAAMTIMAAAIAVLFPETPLAKNVNRWLIEAPARWLNRATVWKIAFWSGLIAAGLLMTFFFEAEGLMVYGFMAPEIAAWALMFDVGVVIDALLITAAIMATNGLKVARIQVRAFTGRAVAAIRRAVGGARRSPPPRPRPTRKPDDDDRPAWGLQPAYRAFSMA